MSQIKQKKIIGTAGETSNANSEKRKVGKGEGNFDQDNDEAALSKKCGKMKVSKLNEASIEVKVEYTGNFMLTEDHIDQGD